ncbi:MAG TPA: TonB-dependent receptor, partial [Bacteroidia bacterium]|nr:TonB-dependent receptor [Bacteroidia bacterium]
MKHLSYRYIFLLAAFFAISNSLSSQTYSISGIVTDSTGANLFGASVILKLQGDTSRKIVTGAATDSTGRFTLNGVPPGAYRMRIMYTGYRPTGKRVTVNDSNIFVGKIVLHSSGIMMSGVDIKDKQIRVTQSGDTTGYNAGAYKTNPDATAEDLVNKLPGVTNENGTVKVNGEEVKQILVDGKPYFGDDPSAAMKNLPAEMVDKVQIYDKSSDQAQFTGFDDGQSKKTINFVTKKNNVNGQFGKVYAGYGTDDRYNAGVTLNLFDNARRITFLGMSNNINQQNFSMSDLTGMMGSSGGSGKPMMMRGGGSGGGSYSRGGQSSNFSVNQLGGITQTNS